MKNIRLLPLWVLAIAVVPLVLFWILAGSIFTRSNKSTIVNDPQAGLAQSFGGLTGAYDVFLNQNLLSALRFSEKENLKKSLLLPNTASKVSALRSFCEGSLKENPLPFLVVVGKTGKVLYDNLNIPKPVPSPTPVKPSKKHKTGAKRNNPILASAADWPGMEKALKGAQVSGLFPFQGSDYLVSLVPLTNSHKTIGVAAVGSKIDSELPKELKARTLNDVAYYSQNLNSSTFPGNPPPLEYQKRLTTKESGASKSQPVSLTLNHEDYLADGIPLLGLDQKPRAFLAVFQPVKRDLVLVGNPQGPFRNIGWILLGAALLLVVCFSWFYTSLFRHLCDSLEGIGRGNLDLSPFPFSPFPEWSRLENLLKELVETFQEKDRISLVLGKVVDPQAAKNILGAKDYFALRGERRECTLLRADLKGFNTLSENMAPEALVEALNQYFTIINELVFKYEGMLDRFMGDSAMAVWGAPFTHEDKEWRAVKAALEIQEALKDFNISRIKKGYPPFTVGIGIHTGWVVAGNLGSKQHYDYSIIGESLHVVSRLCSMAAPGQTVVSGETYEKVLPGVKGNPMNPIAVKGSMEPLNTYEITELL